MVGRGCTVAVVPCLPISVRPIGCTWSRRCDSRRPQWSEHTVGLESRAGRRSRRLSHGLQTPDVRSIANRCRLSLPSGLTEIGSFPRRRPAHASLEAEGGKPGRGMACGAYRARRSNHLALLCIEYSSRRKRHERTRGGCAQSRGKKSGLSEAVVSGLRGLHSGSGTKEAWPEQPALLCSTKALSVSRFPSQHTLALLPLPVCRLSPTSPPPPR